MIKILRIDEIHKCFKCDGRGYIVITDFDLLERIEKKCEQCNGFGLIQLTGGIEIHPYLPRLDLPDNNK